MQQGVSRRSFLFSSAMALGAATVSRGASAWAAEAAWAEDALDPRTATIVAKTFGIDTHNHIDLPMTAEEQPGPDLDLTGEMKRSGLSAICATFATDYQKGNSYDRFQNAMDAMDRQLKLNSMTRALTLADIRSAHKKGQPIVVQSVEGAHFLEGKLERVQVAYDRGLRHLGLLHDSDASVPLGDVYTNAPKFGGLTDFGATVIRECNRLGMVVDLAHANTQTTEGALKLAKRPVIVSHTGLDTQLGSDPRMAQMMRPRLISKEQATIVAKAGGAVGVWTHLSDSPLEYARNVRALVEVIGVEHVCIGTDTKLTKPKPMGPPPGGPDHGPGGPPQGGPGGPGRGPQGPRVGERTSLAWANQTQGFYYVVVDALLKTGFTPDEIGKIGGGNYLRIFGESVKG